MIITAQYGISYSDFVTIVNSIGSIRAVYYCDDTSGGNNFSITVIMADGNVGIHRDFNISTPPSTFSSDFPTAIALPGIITLS